MQKDEPLKQVRDYVFEKKIGEGGMGEVWLARHALLERLVAIKVMARRLQIDPQFEQRFLHEARAMAKLSHPTIVGVTDFFKEGGEYYLVMPFVDGGSLEAMLRSGPIPRGEGLKIALDVLEALGYAHSQGIIHRDVKPSNILVDKSGNAFLTDFGIALLEGDIRMTRTGALVGSPYYMSPEQITKPKSVDRRADIYSFGCVLYEILTGRPPFQAESDDEDTTWVVQNGHVRLPPPDPRQFNPSLPPELAQCILKALAKKPEDRFQDCAAFALALRPGERATGETASRPGKGSTLVETTPLPMSARGGTVVEAPRTPAPAGQGMTVVEEPPKSNPSEAFGVDAAKPSIKSSDRKQSSIPRPMKVVIGVTVVGAVVVLAILAGVIWLGTRGRSGRGSAGTVSSEGTPAPSAGDTMVNPKDGLTYVWIPAGSFNMGAAPQDSQAEPDEKPQHSVTISKGFWLCQTEVTVGAYLKFCKATGGHYPVWMETGSKYNLRTGSDPWYKEFVSEDESDARPVVGVSWDDAVAYCKWLGGRLPTEAEWEYACRAGSETTYYWGDSMDGSYAWYSDNSGNKTHSVGQKTANSWGLKDMLGNAWEWCSDWYGDKYYENRDGYDPQGPSSGQYRVLRGGSWGSAPSVIRASDRNWDNPVIWYSILGFRCVAPTH